MDLCHDGGLGGRPGSLDRGVAWRDEAVVAWAFLMAWTRQNKREWQRKDRQNFRQQNGFSTAAHYATGKLRQEILERDNLSCVECHMTDTEHKARWGRPITIDHRDKNRRNNDKDNLQTLCLSCHGRKDITPRLIVPHIPPFKTLILRMRDAGVTYDRIAAGLGVSTAGIYKWCRRWEEEANG